MSNIPDYRLIGLTGPTGSGKSLISNIFKEHGCAVVDADSVAHKALAEAECISQLTETFGKDILRPDGNINRKELAACAFSSEENTQKLNNITHPIILKLATEEFHRLSKEGYKNIIFDAPTLFESGSHKLCRDIVAVIAPTELRKKRIMLRDNLTDEQATARINAQKADSFYTDRADYTILNDGDKTALTSRTEDIIKELRL